MNDQFQRTRMLIGQENLDKLAAAKVLVFGVGGVGGYVCEALCRAGVGRIDIVDRDIVDVTNINRQIIATHDTVGKPKVEVCRQRMLSINPDIQVSARQCFYLPDRADEFDFAAYDYIVDAVDNVTAKIDIICNAKAAGTPVISSMGTANKLDPTMFKIADIEKTKVCPLAKVVRKELRKRGVSGVKVLYSEEEPKKPLYNPTESENSDDPCISSPEQKKAAPASISFVPPAAGLIIAGQVISDILKM
ncbi:MAG: tRNA threonylcarbamoyladenosine dehydratase [Firmicutes bacterium]|nr:tRNA threonylcarbamoyladenosine dehydratase [Bacillota bacterium]MDY5771490.1 tRNA threonylcarbamoyladenosine dehydratase [Anaerovoracaceae bacterium]